ncbi:hypothetical protein DAPPUDRAFT_322339 [Daphnia pulex]|uniref:Uncharacterized protein n=1 Tax=Daphnia pulex TaxID=6669 RepID=E9GVM6_DAPPU|nr:hypothetical protein DAPPUDRAFT_322339 [Daphnia pulex]|eukprot:EFX76440.1 hypothetical protein DAPPUDRAFT_322339 [Daphnia pulex]
MSSLATCTGFEFNRFCRSIGLIHCYNVTALPVLWLYYTCTTTNLQAVFQNHPKPRNFYLQGYKTFLKSLGAIVNFNWYKTHSNPQQRQPAKGKARKTCQKEVGPIPRNFNLQKERAVRLSFTFEGHGDHYIKRVMQWCRGWVRTGRVSSFSSSYNSRKA